MILWTLLGWCFVHFEIFIIYLCLSVQDCCFLYELVGFCVILHAWYFCGSVKYWFHIVYYFVILKDISVCICCGSCVMWLCSMLMLREFLFFWSVLCMGRPVDCVSCSFLGYFWLLLYLEVFVVFCLFSLWVIVFSFGLVVF